MIYKNNINHSVYVIHMYGMYVSNKDYKDKCYRIN